jgi:F-type H+-transporting ATPase subunit delta
MVAKNFIDSYQKIKGKITATVTSAVPLNTQVINEILDIAKKMTDLQVELKNNIDSKIIGGFILNVGDLQINASVANQLENLGSTLTKTNHIA